MKHVVIATDGKRALFAGFIDHPIIFRSYESALEYAYEQYVRYPRIDGRGVLYEAVPLKHVQI